MTGKRPVVNLLSDVPAENDDFGGHDRVAAAMRELIEDADCTGSLIGLEGAQGAGKSTIVQFLKEKLERDERNSVVVFDAWAHEDDSLRRTFLDVVSDQLSKRGWVKKKDYGLETIKEFRTSNLDLKGKFVAVFALMIPVGIIFLRQAFSVGFRFPLSFSDESIILLVTGLVFTLVFPVIAILGLGLPLAVGAAGEHETIRKDSDPGSIRFRTEFEGLIKEALVRFGACKRRLVVVLDNLDRVGDNETKVIWSTLQTFLQQTESSKPPPGLERVWFVIAYDPTAAERLWGAATSNELGHESYLQKTFIVRFATPPPVFLKWKDYFMVRLRKLLPFHKQGKLNERESDFESVYQVYAEDRSGGALYPTPRDIVTFLNQLGSIYLQWTEQIENGEIPLQDIAYFLIETRNTRKLESALYGRMLPQEKYAGLVSNSALENLAALYFNCNKSEARGVLYAKWIEEALKGRQPERISELATSNPSTFWAELHNIRPENWDMGDERLVALANAAWTLDGANLNENEHMQEVAEVVRRFAKTLRHAGTMQALSEPIVEGLLALLGRVATQSAYETIVDGLSSLTEQDRSITVQPEMWVNASIDVIRRAKSIGVLTQKKIVLRAKPNANLICGALVRADPAAECWGIIQPGQGFRETVVNLLKSVVGNIPTQEVSLEQLDLLRVGSRHLSVDEQAGFARELMGAMVQWNSKTASENIPAFLELVRNCYARENREPLQEAVRQGRLLGPVQNFNTTHSNSARAAIMIFFMGSLIEDQSLFDDIEIGRPGHAKSILLEAVKKELQQQQHTQRQIFNEIVAQLCARSNLSLLIDFFDKLDVSNVIGLTAGIQASLCGLIQTPRRSDVLNSQEIVKHPQLFSAAVSEAKRRSASVWNVFVQEELIPEILAAGSFDLAAAQIYAVILASDIPKSAELVDFMRNSLKLRNRSGVETEIKQRNLERNQIVMLREQLTRIGTFTNRELIALPEK